MPGLYVRRFAVGLIADGTTYWVFPEIPLM